MVSNIKHVKGEGHRREKPEQCNDDYRLISVSAECPFDTNLGDASSASLILSMVRAHLSVCLSCSMSADC